VSAGGHKSGRGRRTVSEEEAQLWAHATRTLERVRAKPRVAASGEPSEEAAPAPRASRRAPTAASGEAGKASPPAKPSPGAAGAKASGPPPLAEFERRRARQLASGKIEIGARIDLHGLRQDEARARLRGFLQTAHAEGHRTVLVIPGKGGEGGADRLGALAGERPRGVIRRSVPAWLAEPDMRAIVLSHTQAGVRHGGAGALYVQLRKGRSGK
jgi:DNA-nicking Smr family endonuclease